jgi:hypothetical protein
VDDAISREIVSVLEPAATEAAVLASEQETLQQDEIICALKRELEAAQYNARRAEKQDDTTDPLCVVAGYVALTLEMWSRQFFVAIPGHITTGTLGRPSGPHRDANA